MSISIQSDFVRGKLVLFAGITVLADGFHIYPLHWQHVTVAQPSQVSKRYARQQKAEPGRELPRSPFIAIAANCHGEAPSLVLKDLCTLLAASMAPTNP